MAVSKHRRRSLVRLALLLGLAGLAGLACWMQVRAIHAANDSDLLFAVGRQRMLTQRVAVLAHQYAAAGDELVRLDLRWELRAAASAISYVVDEHLARDGTDQEPLSEAVRAMYAGPPLQLAAQLRQLATDAAALADEQERSAGEDAPRTENTRRLAARAARIEVAAGLLLPGLDALVEQLYMEHDARIERLVRLQYQVLAATLLMLAAAAAVIVPPGLRRRGAAADQRAGRAQRASNQPAASTPASPPVSTSGSKTA